MVLVVVVMVRWQGERCPSHLQCELDARQALQGHIGSTVSRTDETVVMLEEVAASLWRLHLMLLRGRCEAKLPSMADERMPMRRDSAALLGRSWQTPQYQPRATSSVRLSREVGRGGNKGGISKLQCYVNK